MTCDIHLFVEVKEKGNSPWKSVDEWNTEDKDYLHVDYDNKFYKGGYHSTFALLADVTNYQDIEPISKPRGLPTDISRELRTAIRQWGEDAHSHSFFTLKELLDFDWDKPIQEGGYIDNYQWNIFYKSMKTDHPDYDLRFPHAQSIAESMRKSFTWHKWEIPAKACADDFYNITIPKLKELGKPEDVRIVFFFDN